MMKVLLASIGVFLAVLLAAREARAQQFTLNITPSAFTLPPDDPDTTVELNSGPLQIGYKAAGLGNKNNPNNAWSLSVAAQGPLDPNNPLSNLTFISSFSGTKVPLTTTNYTLTSGTGNMTAIRYATITFYLLNSWTYKAGSYTLTIIFSLSSP